jgi:autotransporter family porin
MFIAPLAVSVPQSITGSIVNEANASISGALGIKIISILNTAAVVIGSGHAGDGVINAGTIGTSLNPVAHSGIEIGSATINGVVSNSGTITAGENGIQLINLKGTTPAIFNAGPASVSGGVTNIGSITSTGTGYAGIALSGSTVANGITNSSIGTINAANGVGILLSDTGKNTNSGGVQSTFVGGPSSVTGGVANQGTIIAKTGIMMTGGSTVDSITNSGTLTATGGTAIDVSGEGAATVTISRPAPSPALSCCRAWATPSTSPAARSPATSRGPARAARSISRSGPAPSATPTQSPASPPST